MALWLALALMTGAAVFVVLGALARKPPAEPDARSGDVAVYRDQIEEIARDRARGLIGEREAENAKAEVARRLIAAAAAQETGAADGGRAAQRRRRIAAVAALIAVPAVALGAYGKLGRPDLPDQPIASRLDAPANAQNVDELIARVEGALARNPDDGRGWAVVAPIYLRLGRAGDSAQAYANAIRLLGSTGDLEASRGEALTYEANGVVTSEAREAFERAARTAAEGGPASVKAKVFLSRAAEQDGDVAGALQYLKGLLVDAPADAPYLEPLRVELTRLAAAPSLPAPKIEDAAVQMSPEDRIAQVRGMVDGLGARLDAAPGGDVGEWLRLVQSRAVLGQADKARAALAAARARFAGDARASARLEALALGLGLEGRGA